MCHNSGSTADRYPVIRSKFNASDWGGWINLAFIPTATESVAGKAEIATPAETKAGTDHTRMTTPLDVATAIYGVPYGYIETAMSAVMPVATTVVPLSGTATLDQMTFGSSAFTIGQAGTYDILGQLVYSPGSAGVGSGVVLMYVQENATLIPMSTHRQTPLNSNEHSMRVTATVALTAGDVIRMVTARSSALSELTYSRASLRVRRIR